MTKYETVYILEPGFDEARAAEESAKVSGWITDLGGEVAEVQKWGKRRLAYEIKHLNEGYYAVVSFSGPVAAVDDLDRALALSDNVLRHKFIRPE